VVAIPAKADVALWPRPVPGWTVIQVALLLSSATRKTSIRPQPWIGAQRSLSPVRRKACYNKSIEQRLLFLDDASGLSYPVSHFG
jgi:hypothetical protein